MLVEDLRVRCATNKVVIWFNAGASLIALGSPIVRSAMLKRLNSPPVQLPQSEVYFTAFLLGNQLLQVSLYADGALAVHELRRPLETLIDLRVVLVDLPLGLYVGLRVRLAKDY